MFKLISIKDVSRQTGITVRTLRYYDHIGLLVPSGKTPGNHRLYREEELMKLQQIQFLKRLGFSLQEIAEMLADQKWNWTTSLQRQLRFVLHEQEKLRQMEAALRGLLNSIAVEGETSWPAIQQLIRLADNPPELKQAFRGQMFAEHELELLEQVPNMNRDDPDSLEWIALLGQFKQHMHEGAASPKIQRIIARMDEKRLADFDGEEAFVEKLWEIRKSAVQSEQMGFYPIEAEVLELLEEAYALYTGDQTAGASADGSACRAKEQPADDESMCRAKEQPAGRTDSGLNCDNGSAYRSDCDKEGPR